MRLLRVLLLMMALAWGLALAQDASQTAPAPSDAEPEAVSAVNRFTVSIEGPAPLPAFLLQHLEVQRYRSLPDLDATELRRLVAQVPGDAMGLLGTLGYMTPQVVARLDAPSPDQSGATSPSLGKVVVVVQAGPRTRVTAVQLRFAGDIANRTDDSAVAQRQAIQDAFSLKVGQTFTQADWDQAKNQAMRALTAQRYPAGRIRHSLADIDPVTSSAALTLELDSGPALRLGDIVVTGTQRYDPAMVERLVRLAGLTPGSDYDLDHVLDAQRRVAASGYFESVFVLVEPGEEPDRAPVQVKVREVLLQKRVIGVGGSTDSGARISLEHTHHSVPGLQWRAISGITLSRNHQYAESTLTSPVDAAGWRWQVYGLLNRQEDASGNTVSQRIRTGQTQDTPNFNRSLFLQYDRARTTLDGQTTEAQSSVSANFGWTLRRLDHLLFPEHGYTVGAELGAGVTLEQSRRPYLRTRLRGLSYLPFADALNGRLAVRADAGAVWAHGTVPVPSTELFLTGGDTSVRGYALRSLGVNRADGTVDPGQVMMVGSVEWQRPLLDNGQRSLWENSFFIDAGAVADRAAQLRPKIGVGTGVRYRSPVGPLQIDLAYGVATHRLRLHMSLGFKF